MSNRQRLTFAAIAAVIAVVALVVLSGGPEDEGRLSSATATPTATATAEATPEATATSEPTPDPTPDVQEIVVKSGKVVGGKAIIDVKTGEKARFAVVSDAADRIHVHGYDVFEEVEAGGRASFTFKADIPGVFEVELEGSHVQVARLRVTQ